MTTTRPIFEATSVCLASLRTCIEIEDLMVEEWAERRLDDFNLWISGTGALARERASLDFRLSKRPEAREVISNLVLLLNKSVEDCKMLAVRASIAPPTDEDSDDASRSDVSDEQSTSASPEEQGRAFSPWSDDSSEESRTQRELQLLSTTEPLQASMSSVDMLLRQLTFIAIAVRKSGRRSRLQKADQLFQTKDSEELEELERHLTVLLLIHGEFSETQINRSNLNEIQQRLIHGNLKRRNRFLFAQRRAMGLQPAKAQNVALTEPRDLEATADVIPRDEAVQSEQSRSQTSNVRQGSDLQSRRTGTSASAASDLIIPLQTPPIESATSTVISKTIVDAKHPHPPLSSGNIVFTCPCCCESLPIELSRGSRWKKHIDEDLCPYLCILPQCSKPYILYPTKDAWKEHMLNDHRSYAYWDCLSCGGSITFRQEADFLSHLASAHPGTIPTERRDILGSIWKRSVPIEIASCPICNWPEGEGVQDGEALDRDALINHIAKELYNFALLSLPWADGNWQESEEKIEHSKQTVSTWLEACAVASDDRPMGPTGQPANQWDLHAEIYESAQQSSFSEYFRRYPYFAERLESQSSSSGATGSTESRLNDLKREQQTNLDETDPLNSSVNDRNEVADGRKRDEDATIANQGKQTEDTEVLGSLERTAKEDLARLLSQVQLDLAKASTTQSTTSEMKLYQQQNLREFARNHASIFHGIESSLTKWYIFENPGDQRALEMLRHVEILRRLVAYFQEQAQSHPNFEAPYTTYIEAKESLMSVLEAARKFDYPIAFNSESISLLRRPVVLHLVVSSWMSGLSGRQLRISLSTESIICSAATASTIFKFIYKLRACRTRRMATEKVEVFILYWTTENQYLSMTYQMERLAHVFEKVYGYSVTTKVNRAVQGRRGVRSTTQANKLLAQWLYDHEGPNTLLIIYFATHNLPVTEEPDFTRVVHGLYGLPSTIFCVLDCSSAAATSMLSPMPRRLQDTAFLLGGDGSTMAEGPNHRSFTSAVVWALTRPGLEVEQLTPARLAAETRLCPWFPRDTTPRLINASAADGDVVFPAPIQPPDENIFDNFRLPLDEVVAGAPVMVHAVKRFKGLLARRSHNRGEKPSANYDKGGRASDSGDPFSFLETGKEHMRKSPARFQVGEVVRMRGSQQSMIVVESLYNTYNRSWEYKVRFDDGTGKLHPDRVLEKQLVCQ